MDFHTAPEICGLSHSSWALWTFTEITFFNNNSTSWNEFCPPICQTFLSGCYFTNHQNFTTKLGMVMHHGTRKFVWQLPSRPRSHWGFKNYFKRYVYMKWKEKKKRLLVLNLMSCSTFCNQTKYVVKSLWARVLCEKFQLLSPRSRIRCNSEGLNPSKYLSSQHFLHHGTLIKLGMLMYQHKKSIIRHNWVAVSKVKVWLNPSKWPTFPHLINLFPWTICCWNLCVGRREGGRGEILSMKNIYFALCKHRRLELQSRAK